MIVNILNLTKNITNIIPHCNKVEIHSSSLESIAILIYNYKTNMDEETAKAIADKQAQLALKKQIIASDSVLKDFNWNLYMPLDQSNVVKSGSAVINHAGAREVSVLQRDVRAPFVQFNF